MRASKKARNGGGSLSRLAPSVTRVVIFVSRAFRSLEERETARGLDCAPDYFILIRKILYQAVIPNKSFTYQGIGGVYVSSRPVHQQV